MKYQLLAVYLGILCLLTSTFILASESRENENTTNHGLNSRLVVMVNPMNSIALGTLNYDHYYQALNSGLDKMSTLQKGLSASIERFSSQGDAFMIFERASTDYSQISVRKLRLEREITAVTRVVYRLKQELVAAHVRGPFSISPIWKYLLLKRVESKLEHLKTKSYLTISQYDELTPPAALSANLAELNNLILTSTEIPSNAECCSICEESLQASEVESENEAESQAVVKTGCAHLFHFDCLKTWLKTGSNSCPLCRDAVINSFHPS